MNTMNIVMQGKGGVGKSLVAALLFQFLHEKQLKQQGCPVLGVDLDALANTFSVLIDGKAIKLGEADFDKTVLFALDGDAMVLDVGSCYYPSYPCFLFDNNVFELLQNNGIGVTIHIPVVSGASMAATISVMVAILNQFPASCRFVVWKNGYFDGLSPGIDFTKLPGLDDFMPKVTAICELPLQDQATEKAIQLMLTHNYNLLFSAVEASPDDDPVFGVLNKQRIARFKAGIFGQLEALHKAAVL